MRLHLKITLWIVVIFVAAGGVSIYGLLLFQRAAALQQFEAMATTLTTTVLHSLITTMVNNNPTEIQAIIGHIRREAIIRRVAIYASDSRVWASSEPAEVGSVQPSAMLATVIATGTPRTEQRTQARELVVITPIPNQRECQSCHAPARRILGAAAVSLGTEDVETNLARSTRLLASVVGFTFLLALGTLSVLLGRFVLDPLSEIVTTVREVSKGNYGVRASVQTTDELGTLARAFNDMSDRIADYTGAQRQTIDELTRRLATLPIFSQTLSETEDDTVALGEAAAVFRDLVRADACAIYRQEVGLPAVAAVSGDRALLEGWGPAVIADATEARTLTQPGAAAALVVPLRLKDRLLGGVVAARVHATPFEPADVTILSTVTGHLAAVLENRRLFREVRDKERLRGELLSKLITAHEDERTRIARELHDEVSQSLTGLMMGLSAVEETVPAGLASVRSSLAAAHEVASQTLEEVRRIVTDLRPTLLDDLGLIPAVRYYARTLLSERGIQVRVQVSGFGGQRLPAAVETTVFRVAQEAMTNVARHAHAAVVTVTLELSAGTVKLVVADDGEGFDAAVLAAPDRRRLGIAGMAERVALLGGTLQITSAPGGGTTVTMAVPAGAVAEGGGSDGATRPRG